MADPASNEVLIYKYFHLDNNLERNTLNDYSIFLNTAIYFHMFNWFGTPYGQEFSCALLIKKSNFCQKVTVSKVKTMGKFSIRILHFCTYEM